MSMSRSIWSASLGRPSHLSGFYVGSRFVEHVWRAGLSDRSTSGFTTTLTKDPPVSLTMTFNFYLFLSFVCSTFVSTQALCSPRMSSSSASSAKAAAAAEGARGTRALAAGGGARGTRAACRTRPCTRQRGRATSVVSDREGVWCAVSEHEAQTSVDGHATNRTLLWSPWPVHSCRGHYRRRTAPHAGIPHTRGQG